MIRGWVVTRVVAQGWLSAGGDLCVVVTRMRVRCCRDVSLKPYEGIEAVVKAVGQQGRRAWVLSCGISPNEVQFWSHVLAF
jgi:hypothetical protein